MLYSICSHLLVNIGLQCSQVCLVALLITFFGKFGMCSLPKDTGMSTTLPYEPCFRHVRIVAKRGHRFVMAACPAVSARSRLDGFHEMSWKLVLRTIMAVCWENPDSVEIWQTYLALYEDVGRLYCRRRHYIAIRVLSSTWKVLGC